MSVLKELEKLLKDDIILELEDYIDDLFEIIAAKKGDEDIKAELKEIQEMRDDFKEMLKELENGEIDKEEAKEIIIELREMKEEE